MCPVQPGLCNFSEPWEWIHFHCFDFHWLCLFRRMYVQRSGCFPAAHRIFHLICPPPQLGCARYYLKFYWNENNNKSSKIVGGFQRQKNIIFYEYNLSTRLLLIVPLNISFFRAEVLDWVSRPFQSLNMQIWQDLHHCSKCAENSLEEFSPSIALKAHLTHLQLLYFHCINCINCKRLSQHVQLDDNGEIVACKGWLRRLMGCLLELEESMMMPKKGGRDVSWPPYGFRG